MPFEEYWSKVKDYIVQHYKTDSYGVEAIPRFEIRIWNLDHKNNKNIKGNPTFQRKRFSTLISPYSKTLLTPAFNNLYLGYNLCYTFSPFNVNLRQFNLQLRHFNNKTRHTIKPLTRKSIVKCKVTDIKVIPKKPNIRQTNLFATMDIETITLNEFDNLQVPVIITTTTNNHSFIFKIDNVKLKEAIINKDLILINSLVDSLWKEYLDFVIKYNNKFETIFAHNLGSFDGYFLYKGLLRNLNIKNVSSIIDDKNKFICISYKTDDFTIKWKDSYRIFPVSLSKLGDVFNVKGKLFKHNPLFNDISIFDNKELLKDFIAYALHDSKSLYQILLKAQEIYYKNYNADIAIAFSTSTLSLDIFRLRFLDVEIPKMNRNEDTFVRKSYFGGATDIYKLQGKDLYYYDVNSLYPYVMLNDMPLELIKIHENMDFKDIENFFGFIDCLVESPPIIKVPILPFKYKAKTIFPVGSWRSTYFSEELKEAIKLGYKITPIKGYEYSKYKLFNKYIEDFYEIKKNSEGPQRIIAKMHLNQLYGYFGRKLELIETVNIHKDELIDYILTRIVKTIIEVDDNTLTLLLCSNLHEDLILFLNKAITLNVQNKLNHQFKSNVGIASAVTAYARIQMMPYKLNYDIYYSDTDSIFSKDKLNDNLIGKEIGLMKDELNGILIKEAIFLGIKQYGYWYLDKNGNRIEQSVFSGVTRNSVSFNEIESLLMVLK